MNLTPEQLASVLSHLDKELIKIRSAIAAMPTESTQTEELTGLLLEMEEEHYAIKCDLTRSRI